MANNTKRDRDSPGLVTPSKRSKFNSETPEEFILFLECPPSTRIFEINKVLKSLKPSPNINRILPLRAGLFKLFVNSPHEVNRLLSKWDNSEFGKSSISIPRTRTAQDPSIVIKNVPAEITDSELKKMFAEDNITFKNLRRIISLKIGQSTSFLLTVFLFYRVYFILVCLSEFLRL